MNEARSSVETDGPNGLWYDKQKNYIFESGSAGRIKLGWEPSSAQ